MKIPKIFSSQKSDSKKVVKKLVEALKELQEVDSLLG